MIVQDLVSNTPTLDKVSTESPKEIAALRIWGRQPLSGNLPVSGAKNSALALMAGALLCPESCRLRNVPNLADIERMTQVLAALGVKLDRQGDALTMDASHLTTSQAPYELVSKLRASFFAIGSLVARLGTARVPLPGGCAIGARPVDLHVRGLQALGAHVRIEHGIVHVDVPGAGGKLKGAKIYLDYPSVGATETLMMAATLAEGETIIENAAQEPEVADLANFCRAMGAKIRGAGTNNITIVGVPKLHTADYSVIPDRIEAGTFLVMAAMTQSDLTISPIIPEHLTPVIAKLEEIGAKIVQDSPACLRVIPHALKATDIETLPYPGFPTDMQAQFTSLLSVCEGNSIITETVFENRMRHVAELVRMGADIRLKGSTAIIKGVHRLSGAPVMATDLRASAALVTAGLAAEGQTIVKGLHHMDRGYDDLEQKLRNIGAKIERFTEREVTKE
ncbi:MAG: UDP-N-acetylglucosamine 1-carboxyvinyltransferase [Spirulina sp. SIO3F2]|nr:UDP-N-acetylglucosamine 1-carboxyvinyltransferase [Spirulina sp. SIO3F2]